MKIKPPSKKKLIIVGIIVIVIVALCVGASLIAKKMMTKTVNVYPVADIMQEDAFDSTTITGTVTNSSIHSYTLESGVQLSKVYVKTGDTVKKGDKLFKYDMSVKELELEKKQLEKQNLELTNKGLQEEINNLQAGKNADGSKIDDASDNEDPDTAAGDDDTGDDDTGDTVQYKGAAGDESDEGAIVDDASDDTSSDASESDAESVKEQVAERQKQIRDNKLSIRQQDINIAKLERELKDNVVKSTVSGVVKSAGTVASANANVEVDYSSLNSSDDSDDEESVNDSSASDSFLNSTGDSTSSAFITIQTTNGSYVQAAIDEYSLSVLNVGDQLTGTSYNTGEEFTATITEKSEFPIESNDSTYMIDGDSSGNVTYYPVKASLDDGLELQDQDYVELQLPTAAVSEDAFYLENAFILTENGNQYVYIEDSDGKLKKKKINVARRTADGMSQVDGGLTADDYIAFPYGKTIQDGAPVKESDIDSLYE